MTEAQLTLLLHLTKTVESLLPDTPHGNAKRSKLETIRTNIERGMALEANFDNEDEDDGLDGIDSYEDPEERLPVPLLDTEREAPTTALSRVVVQEGVRKVVADVLAVPLTQVTLDAKLATDLGCDDIDALDLANLLEEEFEFEVSDDFQEELSGDITVGTVIDTILKLKGESA